MKYSRRNSFILLDEEKKEIRKLYEATTASASGSYSQPLSYKEDSMSPCEASALEPEVEGGDNIVDGSEEINLDVEDLMGMIGLSEEDEKERMRKLHRDASTIIEQSIDGDDCLPCIEKALGKYSNKAQKIYNSMEEIYKDGEVTETEFMTTMGKILIEMLNISYFDVPTIGLKIYKCKDDCESKLSMS
jgi:hypothetical protein|tara:strand:+ start:2113 stop:2679 length:567 start_codon:yes stop_codon:yes gene_type:complete